MKKIALKTMFILFIVACKKEQKTDALPPETQEGKNTFGCLINNEALLAGTTLFGLVSPVNVSYFATAQSGFEAGSLYIQGIDARYSLDIAGFVAVQKMKVFGPGEYSLQSVTNCNQKPTCDASFYFNSKLSQNFFAESGKLTVTKLDTLNKIVSGRFNFMAKDSLGNVKNITDGRFDAKYMN
jgi:hypothetical protein